MMARCIELARAAEGRTAPNPMVGAVVVDPAGNVIAEGFHRRAGDPHAEADALAKLAFRAPGCTLYVNLEPCAHTGRRRTEPCAPRLLDAGLARVVLGAIDPIASHSGGARWLASNGVQVCTGVLESECVELNRGFFTWARERRPWTVLKAAITLDGRVALRSGESQWITGAEARADGHLLRDRLDAICVGIGTVLADDPRLTARGSGTRDPLRVVLDSRLRTPPTARLLPQNTSSDASCVIATTSDDRAARRRLEDAGAEVWQLPAHHDRVAIDALVSRLAAAGVTTLLVEGGAEAHASFIAADLADELCLYLAPLALGGRAAGGPTWLGGSEVASLAQAPRFSFHEPALPLGSDLRLRLRRLRGAQPAGSSE